MAPSRPQPPKRNLTIKPAVSPAASPSLANVYAQVSLITLNGSPTNAYDATNSDASNTLGLDATYGLWGYTNASEDPNAISGVLTSIATSFNTGTRTRRAQNASAVPSDTLSYERPWPR
jgi:hypothetical protein